MKASTDDNPMWVECALLAGLSVLLPVLMMKYFARYRPRPVSEHQPGDTSLAPLEKPKPEEKAEAEPVHQVLEKGIAQVNSPEKASQVAEQLEELASHTTTEEVEQAAQPEKPRKVSDQVAKSSRRIERATQSVPLEEKAATGIAQTAREITGSSGREKAALSEITAETLNPEGQGAPGAEHYKQRKYLRQAVLKRMKPLDALDAGLFLAINQLPHNRWLNGFFSFFTVIFRAGLGWYGVMALAILVNPRRGIRAACHSLLPLSTASSLVEYPIKTFFRRRRPFITFIQAIVIGKKPSSWSFPSGHSASAFAGAWLLSREFPRQKLLFFLIAILVALSRIYLGDHYPGDVVSGALSGITIAENIRRGQRAVERRTGNW